MIRIYSDGGSDNRGNAAAACIIKDVDCINCFSFYLGHGTNNEGEIFAALAGLAYLGHAQPKGQQKIEWIGDSEYALKSATQYIFNWEKNGWKTSQKDPVKNQGLWRTYLDLTRDSRITATHVKGHSGHPENEACDLAVTWVRKNAEQFSNSKLDKGWLNLPIEIGDSEYNKWCVFDAREIIQEIRLHDSSGINKIEFIKAFNFEVSRNILSQQSMNCKNASSDSELSDLKPELQKYTKTYLKKILELDADGSFLKSDTELKKAISQLKTWLAD